MYCRYTYRYMPLYSIATTIATTIAANLLFSPPPSQAIGVPCHFFPRSHSLNTRLQQLQPIFETLRTCGCTGCDVVQKHQPRHQIKPQLLGVGERRRKRWVAYRALPTPVTSEKVSGCWQ